MSLHAQTKQEAMARLAASQRNSSIASMIIAVLTVVLIFLILGFFTLKVMVKEATTIVTYEGPPKVEETLEKPRVTTDVQRKPAAPSSTMTKVIASSAPAAISIPVPEEAPDVPALSFGDGEDFGEGWGDGIGEGSGGGGGFGSGSAASGGLQGFLYDLKKNPQSKPISMSTDRYDNELKKIQDGFKSSKLNDFFQVPKPLFLTHLAIPLKEASEGPASFEAQDYMVPTFWMAHYRGTVTVPRTGTYRFSGTGDNYLILKIDGKPRMHFGHALPRGWKTTSPTEENHQSPYVQGWIVHYGDWIDLRAGQVISIDIGIGEAGGGKLGYILQLEEKGVKYSTDRKNNNRPILPLFTTAPFSDEEIKRLRTEFGEYEIDFKNYVVFPVKR